MQGAVNAESRRALIVVGALYAVTGIVFAWPESHVRMWRFAAWLVSAVAYATHIAYEHFRMRSTPGRTARHVALAVALESLFSPGDKHEISFKIALTASFLLGVNAQQRMHIFEDCAIYTVAAARLCTVPMTSKKCMREHSSHMKI